MGPQPSASRRFMQAMALYSFHFALAGKISRLTAPIELPSMSDALAQANRAARRLAKLQVANAAKAQGRIEVFDENNAPIARILLAHMARQIS